MVRSIRVFVNVTAAGVDSTVKSNVTENVSAAEGMTRCTVQNVMEIRSVVDVISVSVTLIHSITVINVFLVISIVVWMISNVRSSVSMEQYQKMNYIAFVTIGITTTMKILEAIVNVFNVMEAALPASQTWTTPSLSCSCSAPTR